MIQITKPTARFFQFPLQNPFFRHFSFGKFACSIFFDYLCALFETDYDQRRFARLSENAGYGIDRMLMWEQKRGPVEFTDDVVSSTITFRFEKQAADDSHTTEVNETLGTPQKSSRKTSRKTTEKKSNTGPKIMKWPEKWSKKWHESAEKILEAISQNSNISVLELETILPIGLTTIKKLLTAMQTDGIIRRVGTNRGGHWEIINS